MRAAKATRERKRTLLIAKMADVKGLEYDHVVLPYLEQGVFPALLSSSSQEERNLFYVGMTRARQALTLLCNRNKPSEFVRATRFGLTNHQIDDAAALGLP